MGTIERKSLYLEQDLLKIFTLIVSGKQADLKTNTATLKADFLAMLKVNNFLCDLKRTNLMSVLKNMTGVLSNCDDEHRLSTDVCSDNAQKACSILFIIIEILQKEQAGGTSINALAKAQNKQPDNFLKELILESMLIVNQWGLNALTDFKLDPLKSVQPLKDLAHFGN